MGSIEYEYAFHSYKISCSYTAPVPRTAWCGWRLISRDERDDVLGFNGRLGWTKARAHRPPGEVQSADPWRRTFGSHYGLRAWQARLRLPVARSARPRR